MRHQIGASEPVLFELDGKEYRLRFTLGALKALAQEHGINVMKGGDRMIDAVREPANLALLIYHGLKPNHPEVDLPWVENNFDAAMLQELVPVVAQAISGKPMAALPNDDRLGKANGVGLLAGPSDDTTLDLANESSGA